MHVTTTFVLSNCTLIYRAFIFYFFFSLRWPFKHVLSQKFDQLIMEQSQQ